MITRERKSLCFAFPECDPGYWDAGVKLEPLALQGTNSKTTGRVTVGVFMGRIPSHREGWSVLKDGTVSTRPEGPWKGGI